MDDIGDLIEAIAEFRQFLPGWWFTVGSCGVSRDASCGPDYSIGLHTPDFLDKWDDGFHCDDNAEDSTLAGSLRDVTQQALKAVAT